MATDRLTLHGVGMRFAGVRVLEGVSLEVRPHEVLGLCGANGAGKSTLIKVLTGCFDDYEGDVEVGGRTAHLHSPAVARAAGLDAVYQEVDSCIAPDLSVAENLLLNQLASPRHPLLTTQRRILAEAAQVAQSVGLSADLRQRAGGLSLHQKQLLVIARAMAQRVRFLIFDEPTASLSLRETDRLFATIRALSAQGVGIVYVSHRLREIEALCNRVAVLRNGRLVQTFEEMPTTEEIAQAMLGTAPEEEFPPVRTGPPGQTVFEAQGIRAGGKVRGASFAVRQGEIYGITGLVGSGKTELLRAIFGADPRDGGDVRLEGRAVRVRRPADAVRRGIYLVPEERRSQGLFLDLPAYQNITSTFLSRFCRLGVIRPRAERSGAQRIVDQLKIQGNVDGPAVRLSGGNQQKVVIGKWISGNPAVLLLDEVTQGVDIGTRREIYRLVRELSAHTAIVFASSDIDEVMGLADRFMVLYDGRVAGEYAHGEADRQTVIELASGIRRGTVA